jgi:hypothetical protein
MHFWKYSAYAIATAVTLCLAAANTAWAISLESGTYRTVMIAVSLIADVGAPTGLVAMIHYQGDRDPLSAIAACILWVVCSYGEIKGAETWFKVNTVTLEAPALKATEAQKAAAAELETETGNLADIRKQLASERREVKLDALQRREKASLERLEKLRPQTLTTGVETSHSQFEGNELALAFTLWLLSQAAWKMAIGRAHGGAAKPTVLTVRPTAHGEPVTTVPPTIDATPDMYSQTVENTPHERTPVHPAQPVHAQLTLVPKEPFAEQVLTYSKAGFSVRAIAKKMGCSPTKIQNALKAQKTLTTTQNRG